jgi:hypothetical protein
MRESGPRAKCAAVAGAIHMSTDPRTDRNLESLLVCRHARVEPAAAKAGRASGKRRKILGSRMRGNVTQKTKLDEFVFR